MLIIFEEDNQPGLAERGKVRNDFTGTFLYCLERIHFPCAFQNLLRSERKKKSCKGLVSDKHSTDSVNEGSLQKYNSA